MCDGGTPFQGLLNIGNKSFFQQMAAMTPSSVLCFDIFYAKLSSGFLQRSGILFLIPDMI